MVSIEQGSIDKEYHLFENSHLTEINGIQLHYQLALPETEKKGNVLLIHGFSGSSYNWRHQLEFLSNQGYLVLAVDLPAFGFSDKKSNFNHSNTNRAALLKELYETIAPGEKWIVTGHSMGGGTAIYTAAIEQQSIEKLIVVAGAYSDRMTSSLAFMKYIFRFPVLHRWAEVVGKHFFYNLEKFVELTSSAYGRPATEKEAWGYLKPFTIKNSATSIIKMGAYLEREQAIDLSSDIKIPTLIIWGEQDSWVPIEFGRKLESKISHADFFVIQNAGHCPMETHPDIFNEKLMEFLLNHE
jgi:2-hydroxy-6-oxonona-2,4-dienedioate hydrolase